MAVVSVPALLAGAAGIPLLAQSAPAPVPSAEAGDSGVFILRHAGDTIAIERFSRTATSLNGSLAIRDASGTLQAYEAVVAPDESVAMIEVTVRQANDSSHARAAAGTAQPPQGRVRQRARVIFKDDSAAVDDINDHGMQTRIFGTERGAVPYLNLSFALLEQGIRHSRAAGSAAVKVPFFNLGGGQTVEARMAPLGTDSLRLAIGSVEFHLRVDPAGRVLGGSIPAQQLVAERVGGT